MSDSRLTTKVLHRGLWCWVALACVLAALTSLWSALMWWRWHPHLPWRDIYLVIEQLQPLFSGSATLEDWRSLAQPHYAAHRILVPRLLVALDLALFGGRNHLLYLAGVMALGVMVALQLRLLRSQLEGDGKLSLFFFAVVVLIWFAPANWWNLTNAINTSWHLSLALSVLAFYVVATQDAGSRWRWPLAYALATTAAFTTFAGVIAWLMLPLLAVLQGRRHVLVAAVVSAVFTLLYLQGIRSDAAVASHWVGGDAAAAEAMRALGQAALADNGVVQIATKTLRFISWPLSEQGLFVPGVLLALSLWPLVLTCRQLFTQVRNGAVEVPVAVRWASATALFCLGVAVAVQLGRVVEQPNYAHGPSFERYMTVVSLYWTSVVVLLGARARAWSLGVCSLVVPLMLVVAVVLARPWGDYLKQEVDSLSVAHRLYAGGEKPHLRPPGLNPQQRARPEYVYHFDAFFEKQGAAYFGAPAERPAESPPTCGNLALEVAPATRAMTRVEIGARGLQALWLRELLLLGEGGIRVRLGPEHRGDYQPVALLAPQHTVWVGLLPAAEQLPERLILRQRLPGGIIRDCQMSAAQVQVIRAGSMPGEKANDV